MASTAVTVQDMFSGGMANIKDTASKAVIKPKRQLPTRDSQGKFVDRNTGLLLNSLANIFSQLRQLVALTKESLNIEKKDQVVERAAQMRLSLGRAETDPTDDIKDDKTGPGFMDSLKAGWGVIKKPFDAIGTKIMLAGLLGLIVLLGKFKDNLVEPWQKYSCGWILQ